MRSCAARWAIASAKAQARLEKAPGAVIAVLDDGGNRIALERLDETFSAGASGEDALDGMKIDEKGNLYVSGPGGLWIISPDGKHLGTIIGPEHPHNMAWGHDDRKTLYLCAQTGLYRIRLNVPGIRPSLAQK